ncbi:hypothetical protein [Parabacteroides distasonis]|uniref:hypothetical protein n=1 Tax=Parabacteroides distasonis TaxID=823 RepID=UPI0018AC15C6|nr:hypothetical protein [Parabacteroides distasonis]
MENQICTNKKQSSRLLEAGVRPGTADMYLDEFECPVAFEYRRIEGHVGQDMAFPAWSLSKLIDMMPQAIDSLGTLYLCAGLNAKKYNADNKVKAHQYSIEYGIGRASHRYDDPIDALIETIEWLIKEGYLDKKYLTDKCGDCRLIEDEDANGDAWCAFHQKPVRCDSKACKDILEKGGSND